MRALLMPSFSAPRLIGANRLRALAALLAALCAAPAWSQMQTPSADAARAGPPPDFSAEHRRIDQARAWANYRHQQAQHRCYDVFFVAHCLDQAKEAHQAELHAIRARALALDETERAERAARRDHARARSQARYDAAHPQRQAAEQKHRSSLERKQTAQRDKAAQRQTRAPAHAEHVKQRLGKQQDAARRQAELDKRRAQIQRHGQQNKRGASPLGF